MSTEGQDDQEITSAGAGAELRAAREAKGLSLEQVAEETRIPRRHLEMIEQGDFSRLPARTYAIGFARNYARLVGLDEQDIAGQVSQEMGRTGGQGRDAQTTYEPADPARVPSRTLGWVMLFAAVLLVAGIWMFYRNMIAPQTDPAVLTDQRDDAASQEATQGNDAPAGAQAKPVGPVVFTALEDGVWVKFYDADGNQLMQKQMAKGETYTVPETANGPMVWTGRPDALSITVGGRAIPKLAEGDAIMRDVPVTPEALLARSNAPAGQAGATPAPPTSALATSASGGTGAN
ncbi:MAG: helix-turn-helix domain-containing protein [Sphingomonadaceae bacterium]